MSCTTTTPSFTLFPSAPSAPHAFNLLTSSQSPRDNYYIYEEARLVLSPSNGLVEGSLRKTSFGFKKLFGL